MNTGYVVRLSRPFDIESVEQAGQQDVGGGWDWLSNPDDARDAPINQGESDEYLTPYVTGVCTWQTEVEDDVVTVTEDGRISSRPSRDHERKRADWLVIPDEQLGVVSDLAALYYVGEALPPGVDVTDPEIDVARLAAALDQDAWGVGFGGRYPAETNGDGAHKGAVYGERVQNDPDLGEDLEVLPLSQVGFEHTFGHDSLKAYISESGYVAAHGDEWVTRDFVPWVVEIVGPHLRDEEPDEDDDGQTTLDGLTACDECGDQVQNTEQHGDELLCLNCHDDRVQETEDAVTDGGA